MFLDISDTHLYSFPCEFNVVSTSYVDFRMPRVSSWLAYEYEQVCYFLSILQGLEVLFKYILNQ